MGNHYLSNSLLSLKSFHLRNPHFLEEDKALQLLTELLNCMKTIEFSFSQDGYTHIPTVEYPLKFLQHIAISNP